MLRDDANKSSAVYLLTFDAKYAVCGTDFSSNQLLCRKYLAKFLFFVEETFDQVPGNEKDQVSPICRYGTSLWDFDDRRTMILKVLHVYKRMWKWVKTAESNSKTCEWIFHQLAAKNLKVNVVQRSTASLIRYCKSKKKKNYSIHYFLTGQNQGLSELKIIWPVIMTGNPLSVILSPGVWSSKTQDLTPRILTLKINRGTNFGTLKKTMLALFDEITYFI